MKIFVLKIYKSELIENFKRKVNNEAAQRSRSKRRKMLDAKMKRIVMYEQENPKLKSKLETHL